MQARDCRAAFEAQYRAVRAADGYRSNSPYFYRALPAVPRTHPHAAHWRIRRESYRNFLRHVIGTTTRTVHVLDAGAGNGWLAHRLVQLGHVAVALDRSADDADALGAVRHYATPPLPVLADFTRLPFRDGVFDSVVFNGSLHYAADAGACLRRARRLLAPGGALVVMDSPMFATQSDGESMVRDQLDGFRRRYRISEPVRCGAGFLTFGGLDEAAAEMGMRPRFIESQGPVTWRVGRTLMRLRRGRPAAMFGVWVAR